jgi:predicted nucleic acid-binding protein
MSQIVLIDKTALTNFALLQRSELVHEAWPGACTTPAVMAEYQAGVNLRQLPSDCWRKLAVVDLTKEETAVSDQLHPSLGAGERTCIAVAFRRNGLFVSDDYDARRQAQKWGIPVTGSIGILLLAIRQERISLDSGNELLAQLIASGFRSPINKLEA